MFQTTNQDRMAWQFTGKTKHGLKLNLTNGLVFPSDKNPEIMAFFFTPKKHGKSEAAQMDTASNSSKTKLLVNER